MTPNNDTPFIRIGAGFCGSVWTSASENDPQFGDALKREDGGPGRSLWKDFKMQHRTLDSLQQFMDLEDENIINLHILVPSCHEFITPDQKWWEDNLSKFPAGYSRCNIMRSERILPMPKETRELLIEHFCPETLQEDIKASNTNQICLIRPYLGRRRFHEMQSTRPSRFKAFSLWNFPLHIDQMEVLGISTDNLVHYSQIMARTLAMMHWFGEMDANDVEFVLAPPPRLPDCSHPATISNVLGNHVMWLLDFDCCKEISLDETGMDQAATAFLRNDPFYPQRKSSEELWSAFRGEYLRVSTIILQYRQLGLEKLPQSFIEKIEGGNSRA